MARLKDMEKFLVERLKDISEITHILAQQPWSDYCSHFGVLFQGEEFENRRKLINRIVEVEIQISKEFELNRKELIKLYDLSRDEPIETVFDPTKWKVLFKR